MTFAAGLQGRGANEFSFEPSDLTNFNHGTALNPQIISQFMCDTFVNQCGKSKTTSDTCKTVKTAIDAQLASGALAKDQTYADAWLSGLEQAFGIQSSGVGTSSGGGGAAGGASSATVNPEGGAGEGGATQTAGTADQAAGGQQNKENAQANEESDDPNANSGDAPARSAGAAGGTNVQTFTGALNGVSAPPVTKDANSNRPFSVQGDTFVNKGAALQRSCAVQHKGCADAANSGGSASVAECDQQETQCIIGAVV
ncbi:hypothetical protein DB88DRAFT_486197 [Papiliotrema laurentii]|uniref:Uncharacterized protein n=1 Tax=Papiliotrema laurentii TaxID=5418 RepID=A0AAD9FR16_PAPLA|nr:hypothetical protein DB88DRAFT_486197 [Papiliotrema laurentii]